METPLISGDYVHPLPAHARPVYRGKIFTIWQWEQTLYDGTTAVFERVSRPDTAHAVGVLPDGKILLTEDEQPDREAVITPAGGVIEPGETAEACAAREFAEETGYRVGQLVPWHVYRMGGKIEWTVSAFVARHLTRVGDPQREAGERIRLVTCTFEEFLALGFNPKLRDRILRLILLEAQLKPDKLAALKQTFYG